MNLKVVPTSTALVAENYFNLLIKFIYARQLLINHILIVY